MPKKMHGRILPNKYGVGKIEIVHVVKLCVKDVYIKGTEKSLTMSGSTVRGHYVTYQLALLVATQTRLANRHANLISKFLYQERIYYE